MKNEYGQVLFWAFTKSKSTAELASSLEAFSERYVDDAGEYDGPKVMYVDNTHEVTDFYTEGKLP